MSEQEFVSTVTLDQAEHWMRYVASRPDGHDTGAAFRLMVAELDRLQAIEQRAREATVRMPHGVVMRDLASYIADGRP